MMHGIGISHDTLSRVLGLIPSFANSQASFHTRSTLPVSPIDGDGPGTKIGEYATEAEIYHFAMQSYRKFKQAVYGHAYAAICSPNERTSAGQNQSMDTRDPAFHTDQFEGGRCFSDTVPDEEHDELSSRARDVMVAILKDPSCGLDRLEQAVDR